MSSIPKTTKVIVNANPPIGEIKPDTFAVETRDIPELKDGEVLVKVEAFGNEPAQRGWLDGAIDEKRMYAPLIKKGDAVRAPIIGKVVASKSQKYKEGQRVTGMQTWSEYIVANEQALQAVPDIEGKSPWLSLGILGLTGRTAWVGVYNEMNLKPEHTLLVSGAAGAVGTVVIQIAKNVVGCKRVVGIAGGKEKCDMVKSIGADECIDYKSDNFADDLKAALPDYADMFFDNVGGEVLNQGLTVTKRYGFIAVCGAIAGYHGEPFHLTNWFEVIANRITIKGFLLVDHVKSIPKATQELAQWVSEGKITVTESETVVDTKFEDVPKTWQKLFTGENKGKLITKLV